MHKSFSEVWTTVVGQAPEVRGTLQVETVVIATKVGPLSRSMSYLTMVARIHRWSYLWQDPMIVMSHWD